MCTSEIPKFLNEELFRDALNDGFKRSDVNIKSLNLQLASEGGENYCSDIYRANIQFTTDENETKNIALIVKAMKETITDDDRMASKEVDMYKQFVPLMDKELGEASGLTPKCFRATKELYIFQDLGDLGYKVEDRLKGLTESQAHVVLEKIAVFHAASMVVAEKHPEVIEKVKTPYFENGVAVLPIAGDLVLGNLAQVIELTKQWEGFEEITVKLEKLRKTYDAKLIAMMGSNQSKFKVINHGDLWVNNLMLKDTNNICVDAKLIDLQISFYGSPGTDLNYFFTTSIPLDVALVKKYDLLRTYYKYLKMTLIRLNYTPIPSWDDLLNELRLTEFYALHTAFIAMPLIFLEKTASKGNDVDSLNDPNVMKEKRVHMYQSARILEATRNILDRINDVGALD